MKYTSCEALLWRVMIAPMERVAARCGGALDRRSWRRDTGRIYREIIARTPDVGSMRENPLRMSLSGGALWIAGWKAARGRMNAQAFADMVTACMRTKVMKLAFSAKSPFTEKAQRKRVESARRANAIDSPMNWNTEVIPGRDAEEITILYHRCGLCALGRREGCAQLLPHMCQCDFISVDYMGGRLYRTQTLAEGGSCCDFYICKKGSHWDRMRQEARR